MPTKSDSQVNQDVLDELFWDPAVTVADLRVSTENHQVTLNGIAATYGIKLEAENAAYRVAGVNDVENEIFVDPAAFGIRADSDIAADIKTALVLDYKVPDERISISVLDGNVVLSGNVDWYYQRMAAVYDAAKITGVKTVDNQVTVMQPGASASDIASGIAQAFTRNIELFDDNIDVSTDGGQVTLSGTVETWSERFMAEDVAWRSPGVTAVTNNILVLE